MLPMLQNKAHHAAHLYYSTGKSERTAKSGSIRTATRRRTGCNAGEKKKTAKRRQQNRTSAYPHKEAEEAKSKREHRHPISRRLVRALRRSVLFYFCFRSRIRHCYPESERAEAQKISMQMWFESWTKKKSTFMDAENNAIITVTQTKQSKSSGTNWRNKHIKVNEHESERWAKEATLIKPPMISKTTKMIKTSCAPRTEWLDQNQWKIRILSSTSENPPIRIQHFVFPAKSAENLLESHHACASFGL